MLVIIPGVIQGLFETTYHSRVIVACCLLDFSLGEVISGGSTDPGSLVSKISIARVVPLPMRQSVRSFSISSKYSHCVVMSQQCPWACRWL